MRILAVDDDQNVLDILQVILSIDGFKINLVTSPLAALRVVNERISRFDIILLDIVMPEMDGISLCQKIRTNPRYLETPIVMLTAKSERESIKGAFSAGATDFISKPFDIHEVSARIRVASSLSSTRNQIEALRRRARIETRRLKMGAHGKLNVAGNEALDSRRQGEARIHSNSDAFEGPKIKVCPTRAELVQLFSHDFSQHGYLERRQKRTRAW